MELDVLSLDKSKSLENIKLFKVATLVATFVLCITIRTHAQKHEFGVHEIGGFVSNSFYKGSLSSTPTYKDFNPSGTIFYRRNLNPVSVLRTQFSFLKLSYSDKNWSSPISNKRNSSFNINFFEFAELYEYNFFDYRGENKRVTWAPYLLAGGGLFLNLVSSEGIPVMGLCVPMGLGLKSNLGKQCNIGIEFLARKVISDKFDSVNDLSKVNGYQAGDVGRTDWYYSIGLFFSYTQYSVNCPKY